MAHRFHRPLAIGIAAIVLAALPGSGDGAARAPRAAPGQPAIGTRTTPVLTMGQLRFRDANRDGRLTPYEDWRLSPERRAADLVARMTLAEKAGAMLHPVMGAPTQVTAFNITSVLTRSRKDVVGMAEENNAFQAAAEATRLGIPVTISTDPRYVFTGTFGESVETEGFTKWPDTPGWGAIGDAALARRVARIIAREYRAVGITMALSPQADVATDPRWSRVGGTYGEDFATVGRIAAAYIEGIQGSATGLRPDGVAAIVKHFAGYGAAKDGWDSHNRYGQYSVFPGGRFGDHVAAFRPSFRVKVAGVMPTYSILDLPGHPPVGGAFNPVLLDRILRRQERYTGLVLTDWSVTEDCRGACRGEPDAPDRRGRSGKPWGLEDVPRAGRIVATLNAGADQIGYDARDVGEDGAPIMDAVRSGKVPLARIDAAVRRIMTIKFQLGLFENPFVDAGHVRALLRQPAALALSRAMQQQALVLLENRSHILPLTAPGKRVFLRGIDRAAAVRAGLTVVDRPDQAELAIVRITAPYQTMHPTFTFGKTQREGDLDFKTDDPDLAAITELSARLPTIVTVQLKRPAILTNIRSHAAALIGDFGITDDALLAVLVGRARPGGALPFELPATMAAASAQLPDVPRDSRAPLYAYGYGLRY